jgi:hypothetical protein
MHGFAAQGAAQGNGMAHTALWAVWRYDNYIAQSIHGLNECANAGCGDAVVVAHQDEGSVLPICHIANLIRKSARVLYFHTRNLNPS